MEEIKKKQEWVELTERDVQILKLLAKFKAMTAATILALVGMADNYGRKRIQKLVRCGYLEKSMLYVNRPSIYTLTSKGLTAINSDYPYYSVQNDNAYHEAVVAMIAAWLHLHHDIPMEELLSEREMKRKGIKFGGKERTRPDLFAPTISFCVEYERHSKTTEKTRRKIVNNSANCDKQLWVIEESNQALHDRIDSIAAEDEYSDCKLAVITRQFIDERLTEGANDHERQIIRDFLQ